MPSTGTLHHRHLASTKTTNADIARSLHGSSGCPVVMIRVRTHRPGALDTNKSSSAQRLTETSPTNVSNFEMGSGQETISGTESTLSRKHASIRYATGNSSFEVELEDVPAIFEVSHATGRCGLLCTICDRVSFTIVW